MNKYDEKPQSKQDKLKVKTKVYNRYSNDQDFVFRSFERRVTFCEESEKTIENNEQQIDDKKDKPVDKLVMNEVRKISDTVLPMLKTEVYYPPKHPELTTKYGMLGGKD